MTIEGEQEYGRKVLEQLSSKFPIGKKVLCTIDLDKNLAYPKEYHLYEIVSLNRNETYKSGWAIEIRATDLKVHTIDLLFMLETYI